MGIFDLFVGILKIIDPTSSSEEMQKKIESNLEETINDDNYDVGSIEPEDDFNNLVMDIMNDYDKNPDTEDGDVLITDDNDG